MIKTISKDRALQECRVTGSLSEVASGLYRKAVGSFARWRVRGDGIGVLPGSVAGRPDLGVAALFRAYDPSQGIERLALDTNNRRQPRIAGQTEPVRNWAYALDRLLAKRIDGLYWLLLEPLGFQ